MGKRKLSEPERKRFDILIAAIFEGDSCEAVSIINPYFSPLQTICLGEKLVRVGHLMIDRDDAQRRVDDLSIRLNELTGGRSL